MPQPIEVLPYDGQWRTWFVEVSVRLRLALGDVALRIDHIGSTSVPGLDAKPVLDIQVSVADLEPSDSFRIPLTGLGYVFHTDNTDLAKRYFREPPGTRRTHIHVRRAGGFQEQTNLLFRDYLRTHPDAAAEYAALKHKLADQFRDDRIAYIEAKGHFVWSVLRGAHDWAQTTGWRAGPSDA
jgi:GrpB-like predicted nucleotidyltransferase (UPF0157 family)